MQRLKGESDLDYIKRQLVANKLLVTEKDNEIKRTIRAAGKTEKELSKAQDALATVGQLHKAEVTVPKWVSSTRSKGKKIARPVLMLSDLHLDEVVDLDAMGGYNAYDRAIAEARLERVIDHTVDYLKTYTAGVEFDGITCMLGGDIVTGVIHEELANTNDAPLPDTIQHWIPLLASAIRHLADEFGRVHVPCVDGNHDRSGKRYKFKQKAQDSWAWTIYCMLAYVFRDDNRIDITVSESSELIVPVFDTNIFLVHGDGAKGGGGIGGVAVPIARYVHKKQMVMASLGQTFDFAVMGHFHQKIFNSSFFVNGSLKGYDEYAKGNGFGFERPEQILFLVTPERGVTMQTAIHAE